MRAWPFIVVVALFAAACRAAPPEVVSSHVEEPVTVASTPREPFVPREPRVIPAESLIRSYTAIFGDLVIPENRANYDRSNRNARYLGWQEHFAALGLPDYTRDQPRTAQTNTVMIAAFERIGVALCDRAAARELYPTKVKPLPPEVKALVQVDAPPVFAFEPKAAPLSAADFTPRYDVLHRTFLGYPAALAPPEREREFFELYKKVEDRHAASKKGHLPHVAGWSAVCQAFVRHPEFHQY